MTAEEKVKLKNKYFGTDGFRGEVNIDLNSEQAFRPSRAQQRAATARAS